MARIVTSRDRQLRYELVEAMVTYIKECASLPNTYSEEDISTMTTQVGRCAKTLGAKNISLCP